MGQIQELEQRITSALARISAGVEALVALPPPAAAAAVAADPSPSAEPEVEMDVLVVEETVLVADDDTSAADDLQMALDEERMANAQLNERVRVIRDQSQTTEVALRAQIDSLTRALDAQGLDVQRLSSTVAQLREDLRRLREAAEQGVIDPQLINKAMHAELEALRATRQAEANEMQDILSALTPILDAEEARTHA